MNTMFIKDVKINWDDISERSYVRSIPAIASIDELKFSAPVTYFVGENGSGKSTLLEAIAISYGFNPEGGTKNYSFSTYDSHSEMCGATKLSKGYIKPKWGYFLRAESFYNVATKEDEYSRGPGGKPQFFHKRSHGESFMQVVESNFGPNGIYILDEPEAALSPQRQLTLLYYINKYAQQGSQFIIASHSPILLGLPDAEIMCFDDGAIHSCTYEETNVYQISEMFINNREAVLHSLFNE